MLPFDFTATLQAFECPETIEVYEKVGEYVDGIWTEYATNHRTLSCILLNADEKKQNIAIEGRSLDGAYCVMFPEYADELFVMYQQNEFRQNMQSYLIIDGLEYVVLNNPETVKNAGFRSYYAVRYKEQVVQ